jgi:mono/diheme cytochrome c family protein
MRRSSLSKSGVLLSAIALLAWGAAMAQSPTYRVGRPPTEEELRRGNNIVGSDGRELPAGKGTAKEGATLFAVQCAFCHGKNGEGMFPNPRLVGGVGTLNTPNPIKTVGSNMPYPTTIWDFINRAMPPWPYEKGASPDRSLTPDNVYALTAFLLYKNAIIKESDVMDKNTLLEVQMPNRHGFYPDPPQSAPDKDHSWQPYWDQVKPGADASVK